VLLLGLALWRIGTEEVMSPVVHSADHAWRASWVSIATHGQVRPPDILVDASLVPSDDAVLLGLAGLLIVAVVATILRTVRGRATSRYVVSIVGAASLGLVWSGLAPGDESRQAPSGISEAVTGLGHSHAHADQLLTATDLLSTDELTRHLAHLPARDFVVTETQRQTADSLISATMREAARFADPTQAMADGYVNLSVGSDQAQVAYLYDRGFVRNRTWIDPGRPQAWIYLQPAEARTNEMPRLVGAAFLAPAGEGPRLGGGLTIWFPHGGLCLDDDEHLVARSAPAQSCPIGSRALPWIPEVLHVWLFNNPNGAFAGRLTQEAAAVVK
jgi:hypothetical protein